MVNSINRPAGIGRKLVGALIDLFLVFFLTVLINSYIVTPVAHSVSNLQQLEEKYEKYDLDYNIYAVEYGIFVYDEEQKDYTYSDEFIKLSEKEQQVIVDAFNDDERVEKLVSQMTPVVSELNKIYFILIALSLLIPELIIFLVVPLLLKRSATIGQVIMKLGTVHKGDFEAKTFQIVLRFLTIYLIETLLMFYFMNYMALLLSPLISLIVMACSSTKSSIHDMMSSTKVVKNDALIFENYAEKMDYLNKKENPVKEEKTYDAETKELIDNFKFIDEQEQRILNSPDNDEPLE